MDGRGAAEGVSEVGRGSDADLVAVVESAELWRFPLHGGRSERHHKL